MVVCGLLSEVPPCNVCLLLVPFICPSRTNERGGEGDCVKEGGGGEGERERERALGLLLSTAHDIEVDPQRRRFGCRESDFALQRLVECRALETKRVRVVALR